MLRDGALQCSGNMVQLARPAEEKAYQELILPELETSRNSPERHDRRPKKVGENELAEQEGLPPSKLTRSAGKAS